MLKTNTTVQYLQDGQTFKKQERLRLFFFSQISPLQQLYYWPQFFFFVLSVGESTQGTAGPMIGNIVCGGVPKRTLQHFVIHPSPDLRSLLFSPQILRCTWPAPARVFSFVEEKRKEPGNEVGLLEVEFRKNLLNVSFLQNFVHLIKGSAELLYRFRCPRSPRFYFNIIWGSVCELGLST